MFDTPHTPAVWSDLDAPLHGRPDWTLIRAGYDAGESAPVLAARHGISVSAIRAQARRHGWRRADAPFAAGAVNDPDLLEARPALELADLAWRRLSDAVEGGRLMEAVGWYRMHGDLRGEARNLALAIRSEAADRERTHYRPSVLDPAGHPGAPRPGGAGHVHDVYDVHADVHVHVEPRDAASDAVPGCRRL